MRCHPRFQRFGKELPRPHIAIIARGALQSRHIIGRNALPNSGKHLVLAFGKPIEIVHKIDQQKFSAQCLWKGWPDAEVKRAPAERETAMSLVIVNDSLVVKLCRPDAKPVVSIGRD